MLFRSTENEFSERPASAFPVFQKTQESFPNACGILFQSEHSRLAGALASALLPSVFGPLNRDVIAAITHHDYGWDASDRQQLDRLPEREPYSFMQASPEATLPCWTGSIAHGHRLGPLAAVLISRHCCLLGTGSGKHAGFVAEEAARRVEIERALPYRPDELKRWVAALGFCDLLSLYLCSGSESTVTLPLAHPADAADAGSLELRWRDGCWRTSERVLQSDVTFFARGVEYPGSKETAQPMPLQWAFTPV